MKAKNAVAKLKSHCGKPHHIGIERSNIETHKLYGFVLACSSELVLIFVVYDFHPEGYQILRISDISGVRHSASDRTMQKILRAEGILEQVGLKHPINLQSWQSALRNLKTLGENVIVEGEEPEVDVFLIGKIIRINKKTLSMRYFDGTGKWDEELSYIPFEDITSVKFHCNYVNVFSRHLRT